MSTGEFRAMPDVSASTAQFQAFAENGGEPTGQWQAATPARSPARLGVLVGAGVIVIAIIVILIVTLG